ncbi:MAG: hypothetical protein A2W31_09005 [Planctomycetes bacterium RBG_16_64_10]|nr:MAG: hypothetical protein A2W31_09005 [Planctomycetes bacterium RBG_16_64_10]
MSWRFGQARPAWCRGAALTLVLLGGCAGYQVGTHSLYAPNINTVYVPVFESDSFRRGLGEQLTEAVVKQIELKTPYKVVGDPNADSILTGRLVAEKKRVLVENYFDYAREIQVDFVVQVSWIDRRGDLLCQPTTIPLPANLIHFGQTATLVPEAGQSIATAHQETIGRLADQIVATMEAPW